MQLNNIFENPQRENSNWNVPQQQQQQPQLVYKSVEFSNDNIKVKKTEAKASGFTATTWVFGAITLIAGVYLGFRLAKVAA